jgi:hypothetical protein
MEKVDHYKIGKVLGRNSALESAERARGELSTYKEAERLTTEPANSPDRQERAGAMAGIREVLEES